MLRPSPVIYVAIAMPVIFALSRAARTVDVETALRTMNRGATPTVGGIMLFPFPSEAAQ